MASGSPVPRRRTLTSAFVASVRSEPASLRHPWLRSHPTPAYGARATPRCSALKCDASCWRSGEAGIGERSRSDEVLRETTRLLPAPPTNHPQAGHRYHTKSRGASTSSGRCPAVRLLKSFRSPSAPQAWTANSPADTLGRWVCPISHRSIDRAASRPSWIAHTTSDWPRRMSPAAKTPSRLVL